MMHQSSALRKLEKTLDSAITNGNTNKPSGPILLEAMKLSQESQNLVYFYELLVKAKDEVRSIKNNPKINTYLKTLEQLHNIFIVNHVWNTSWNTFADYINQTNVIIVLDSLAHFFYNQNPKIFLEQDFLDKLNDEFKELLDKITESELSKDLKQFLRKRIEDILKAISKYEIDGTEGLEKATKSFVSDLVMSEHSFKDEDKGNPVFKRVKALLFSSLIYITPSPYDIIGAVPDIYEFWTPKFEELAAYSKKIEHIISETSTIQEAFEKATNIFDREAQKSITGSKPQKALPASKENIETTVNCKSDSKAQ
jgi:hypothetical protein